MYGFEKGIDHKEVGRVGAGPYGFTRQLSVLVEVALCPHTRASALYQKSMCPACPQVVTCGNHGDMWLPW